MPIRTHSEIQAWLQNLYTRLPHHNYGWWLITREHPEVSTLVTACQFLYARFGQGPIDLSDTDYNALQTTLGREVPAEGARQVINRHLLLNLWRPWRMLERETPSRINPFRLTVEGLNLARGVVAPRGVLESILRRLTFVDPRWTRPDVASQYSGISVRPFEVFSATLPTIGDYLNRDEYRLFLARLRNGDVSTIGEAVDLILGFRQVTPQQRSTLIDSERGLFPNDKTYHNWVDMDLHTFSLFAGGESFRRIDANLVIAGSSAAATALNTFIVPAGASEVTRSPIVPHRRHRSVVLRSPAGDPALDIPPVPDVQVNNWQEAEDFVAQLLQANSFEVRDFSRLRNYGFDLWARHPLKRATYYVEVKSSLSRLATVELTRLEAEAAKKYRDRYLLVCVENWNANESLGDIYVVQDPWGTISSLQTPRASTSFAANRSEWMAQSGAVPGLSLM